MTIKELRISKGLTQAECAAFLGMSTRNYQNYEIDSEKENTAKYHAAFRKLEAYGNEFSSTPLFVQESSAYFVGFRTNVVTGAALVALTRGVAGFEKRDCFAELKSFISRDADGRIAILYGLRRTGKTTLIFQMIRELPAAETAYIKVKTTDNMSLLTKDLDALFQKGFRYVFIDEVTLMEDFIGTAALLSDIFATMGMKIVVSGTDSLGFAMANRDELFDRNVMIHTSFISFREYSRLLGIPSVDAYIEYGGTLRMENAGFNDPDVSLEEAAFRDDESTRKYIDSAISRNIQHTLKNDRFGENMNELRELYDHGELTNVINRTVESMSHRFLLQTIEKRFVSHDLGSVKELLLHEFPSETAHILYDIDADAVVERLKKLIDVREKSETVVPVTEAHLLKVKKYLHMLDLLVDCTERYESRGQAEYTMFSQPGMRFSLAKALVYSLMQDDYFNSRPEREKAHVAEKILEDVKGRMLEDVILLETEKTAASYEEVFRFKFDDGGEYDMVVYDKRKDSCRLYEVKHSTEAVDRQTRFLRDEARLSIMRHRFGEIEGRFVIYRGAPQMVGEIQYINVEAYLNSLGASTVRNL